MKARTYSDVLIEPRYSKITSRDKVDIGTWLANVGRLELPIISANMSSITEIDMIKQMAEAGGLGILHRFMSIDDNIKMFKSCMKLKISPHKIGVSVGVKKEGMLRFRKLLDAGAFVFCVDVAHGDHILVQKMIHYMRACNSKICIIGGNVATPEGACNLMSWGVDIVKVGIGPGMACKTRTNTGVGVPQLFALEAIHNSFPFIPMIADGGIRNTGDVAKAMKYASAVMVGAVLAGTIETPGAVYPNDEEDLVNRTYYKVYRGSSTAQVKGANRFVEGSVLKIPFKGHAKYILNELRDGLKSAFSYVGAKNIHEYREKVNFINLEIGSKIESKI